MKPFLPDPIELMQNRIDRNIQNYTEGVCVACDKMIDYEPYSLTPTPDALAVCAECAGVPDKEKE